MAAEKEVIQKLFEGWSEKKATPEKESSSSEEAEKPSKKRKTLRDLVAWKKTGGKASKGRKSRKGATPASRFKGKKVPEKKVPSKVDLG